MSPARHDLETSHRVPVQRSRVGKKVSRAGCTDKIKGTQQSITSGHLNGARTTREESVKVGQTSLSGQLQKQKQEASDSVPRLRAIGKLEKTGCQVRRLTFLTSM